MKLVIESICVYVFILITVSLRKIKEVFVLWAMLKRGKKTKKTTKFVKDVDAIILSHWFRVLIKSCLSFDDISKIIIEYAAEYEEFDEITSDKTCKIKKDGQLLRKKGDAGLGACNGFGKFEANPGRMYHWKLKAQKVGDKELNIGVIEADFVENGYREDWWNESYGYSYFAWNGDIYNKGQSKRNYGDKYGVGDIIDIWLDLKDEYELSFAKNGEKYGKAADMKKLTNYKLAIGMYRGIKAVEILSFEIQC